MHAFSLAEMLPALEKREKHSQLLKVRFINEKSFCKNRSVLPTKALVLHS